MNPLCAAILKKNADGRVPTQANSNNWFNTHVFDQISFDEVEKRYPGMTAQLERAVVENESHYTHNGTEYTIHFLYGTQWTVSVGTSFSFHISVVFRATNDRAPSNDNDV